MASSGPRLDEDFLVTQLIEPWYRTYGEVRTGYYL